MPTIFVDENGTVSGLQSEVTDLLGLKRRQRVSHIEPVNLLLRRAFHWIRRRVSDESIWAEITRRWPCLWQVSIFNGPVLGPFSSRAEAISAEIKFLNSEIEKGTCIYVGLSNPVNYRTNGLEQAS